MSITSVKSGDTGISLALENNYMEPIATYSIGAAGSGTIIFSGIPQVYKHLQLRVHQRITQIATDDQTYVRFNGDAGNNYSYHYLAGQGSSGIVGGTFSSNNILGFRSSGASSGANIFGVGVMDILDYSSNTKNKTTKTLTGSDQNGSGSIFFWSGMWQNTNPITSIYIIPNAGIAQYSRYSLYGIKG